MPTAPGFRACTRRAATPSASARTPTSAGCHWRTVCSPAGGPANTRLRWNPDRREGSVLLALLDVPSEQLRDRLLTLAEQLELAVHLGEVLIDLGEPGSHL